MQTKKYRVKMLLAHKTSLDMFSVGIIDVSKNLETGAINRVDIPITLYESVSWEKALEVLDRYKKNNVASDKFVTTLQRLAVDTIIVDINLLRNEHEMILQYMELQEDRTMSHRKGTIQKIKDTIGVYMDDAKEKPRFRIDREEIKQQTLMIMIAIDEVKRDNVHELLEYYEME